jgi:hypothetical protein
MPPVARHNTPPGPATDISGQAVIDPTKNVLDLVAAAMARQDDLREMESAHMRELLEVRAELGRQLREAETARIDAVRAIDVGAVQRAAEVQAAQAEALRKQVEATATAATVALAASLEPIQKDIADLRRAQYEAQGQKAQVVETRGSNANIGMWVGVVVGIVGMLFGLAGVVVAIFSVIQ